MGAIGITFTILAVLAPRFSITTSVGSIVSVPVAGAVISVCMFGGSLVSARFRQRRFMLEWPTIENIVRRTLGGILMGLGALLIPGGNDTLLMIGFPMGAWQAALAYVAARCVGCRTHRQIRFDGKILVMTVGPCHTSPARPAASTRLAGSGDGEGQLFEGAKHGRQSIRASGGSHLGIPGRCSPDALRPQMRRRRR